MNRETYRKVYNYLLYKGYVLRDVNGRICLHYIRNNKNLCIFMDYNKWLMMSKELFYHYRKYIQ